ncbi:hypothetical protein FNV43_RR23063 [Rhamnella rubrinervis]|uniref:Uncharacterized protein n=1 Tax=Rhamnella rubrinervis TaxID=2594499 RepID=A0A8K0GSL4_9ROSA|nr:hypothetical protein FNV43_RR23063 [Rhamnella rubrinervis]
MVEIKKNKTDDDDDDDDEDGVIFSKLRSINYILKRPTVVNRFEGSGSATKRRREAVDEECEVKVEVVEEEGKKGRDLVLKLAREIRAFGERFVGMESMKMEILRETERCRMEMESKKMEMIMKSHNKIVDSIARAFESSNQFNLAHQET